MTDGEPIRRRSADGTAPGDGPTAARPRHCSTGRRRARPLDRPAAHPHLRPRRTWRPGSRPSGADVLIVESDAVKGPVLDLPLRRDRLVPGRPQQRRHRRRHRTRHPRAARPGRNADAVAEIAVGPPPRGEPRGIPGPTATCAAGEVYRDGTLPYQRFRAWQIAGQTVGIVGLGAVGRAAAVALRRPRHAGHHLRSLRTRRHALARRPARRSRRRLHARGGHTRDRRDDRRRRSSPRMREGAVYINSARARLHDTDALVAVAGRRPPRRRRPRSLRR